jgi:hypothetical protein
MLNSFNLSDSNSNNLFDKFNQPIETKINKWGKGNYNSKTNTEDESRSSIVLPEGLDSMD